MTVEIELVIFVQNYLWCWT